MYIIAILKSPEPDIQHVQTQPSVADLNFV